MVDVLTSVQKTEESLRRLKSSRAAAGQTERATASGISDDDKIRLQLHVDIVTWATQIEKLGVNRIQVDKLATLIGLVEESTKIRSIEKH